MSELTRATRELMRVAAKAKKRLHGTNIMGQKLDKPLVDELVRALEVALKATDEEEQREMKDAQIRDAVRHYTGPLRRA